MTASENTLSTSEVGFKDFFSTLKPRVMSLVIFTGGATIFMVPQDFNPLLAIIILFSVAVGSGAAGAANVALEIETDARMARTANRPTVKGIINKEAALVFSGILGLFSFMILWLASGWKAASLLLLAMFVYIVVYTLWLKPRTPSNIVIGGLSGALPPLIVWVGLTNSFDITPLAFVALIFFWTPPHFWALSLYCSKDYKSAGIPMYPNVHGEAATRTQILIYSILLIPISIIPTVFGELGLIYGIAALILSIAFFIGALTLYRNPSTLLSRKLFKHSIYYLFAVFSVAILDTFIHIQLLEVRY